MTGESPRLFILLSCASDQAWAIPQSCLAEIVTVSEAEEQPPATIDWRGCSVPVLDLGVGTERSWRDPRSGSGLVAVMLGVERGSPGCWGVAVRNTGLGISELAADQLEELPEAVLQNARAAFRLDDVIYQVPDLPAWQQAINP